MAKRQVDLFKNEVVRDIGRLKNRVDYAEPREKYEGNSLIKAVGYAGAFVVGALALTYCLVNSDYTDAVREKGGVFLEKILSDFDLK